MRPVVAALPSLLLFPLVARAGAQARPDSASFVTRLGSDTLVVERMVRHPRRIEAEVLLRVPRTTRTRYVLELGPSGELVRMEAVAPLRRETLAREGDSLRIEVETDSGRRVRTVAADLDVLPFIDMAHWPYEVALIRFRASGAAESKIPLLAGQRPVAFAFATVGADSMTITHPSRGTMRLRVDAAGRLLGLDASATTRKLVVERRPWMSLDALAERWTSADAAGRGIGTLSGRAQVHARVAGAAITIDHGTPAKRGREIWGALVPFGAVWRTGANRATHFTTDRALSLGAGERTLVVPAGPYTLFSIPEQHGGTLIVSRDTGQGGTAYDPARDVGRVPLEARPLDGVVELFTIAVTEQGAGGWLRLQWDRTELVVPIGVPGRGAR